MKNIYINPRKNIKIEDCRFYHTVNINGEVINGDWDLTNCIDDYLSNLDFNGKRVIDIGSASGYLSFEMEKRGADVVSLDMPDGSYWDHLIKRGYEKPKAERTDGLFNSYDYLHERLNSKNKIFRANIYDPLPEEIGEFDVAVFGTMLSHVMDPIRTLMNILYKVNDYAILINHFQRKPTSYMSGKNVWWNISQSDIMKIMLDMGFKTEKLTMVYPRNNLIGENREYKSILFKRC